MTKQDRLNEIGRVMDCIKKETILYHIGIKAIIMEVNAYLCPDGDQ